MSTLVIEIDDTDRDVHERFTFDASPVRIGRSQLNELPLPFEFVSHCHGILTFRPGRCEYVDLGSTNGTFVDGARIQKNVPHPLSPTTVLSIGKLQLKAHQTNERVSSRHSYAFDAPRILAEAEAQVAAAATPPRSLPPLPAGTEELVDPEQQAAMYETYRRSWHALHRSLALQYRALAPSEREPWISEILRRFPDLPQEAEFRALVSGQTTMARSEPSGDIVRVVARLTGEAPRTLAKTAPSELEQQVVTMLERCMQAFVELRDGHAHFMSELGLRAITREPGALSSIASAADALRYFLGTTAKPAHLEELARAYTDIMTHQVALLNGVIAGARELLARLEAPPLPVRASGLPAWLAWLVGRDSRSAAQRRLLADLQDEGALTAALFGRAFARTYAASIGQQRGGQASLGTADSTPLRDLA